MSSPSIPTIQEAVNNAVKLAKVHLNNSRKSDIQENWNNDFVKKTAEFMPSQKQVKHLLKYMHLVEIDYQIFLKSA